MDFLRLGRQGGRYLLTGGISAFVDIGGFALGLSSGLAIIPAATASFLAATLVNYSLTSKYVFHQQISIRRYVTFLAAASIGLFFNVALTTYLATETRADPILAKLLSIGLTFILNFMINAFVVFRGYPDSQP